MSRRPPPRYAGTWEDSAGYLRGSSAGFAEAGGLRGLRSRIAPVVARPVRRSWSSRDVRWPPHALSVSQQAPRASRHGRTARHDALASPVIAREGEGGVVESVCIVGTSVGALRSRELRSGAGPSRARRLRDLWFRLRFGGAVTGALFKCDLAVRPMPAEV